MTQIHEMNAVALAEKIRTKELSAQAVLEHFLRRIETHDSELNCFLSLNDKNHAEAEAIDSCISAGEDPGILAGVPVAIKDNIDVEGMRTTCGSRFLENFVAPFDATVVKRLKKAGAVIIGKTNLDEFAMGSSTENSAFGPTRNPWDKNRIPGGSSGGSAAAVAARLCPVSLGSDTGGSIRQPASFCGVLGVKPTYGRVSRYGLVAFGSSLDQVGPFTNSAHDAARVTGVLAGSCDLDSTAANVEVPDYEAGLDLGLNGLRIGVPKEFMAEGIDESVRNRIQESIDLMKEAGAKIVEVSLPHTKYAIPVYYIVATSEASSNLARYDGVGYGRRQEDTEDIMDMFMKSRLHGFGDEVKRRIMLGTYCLSSGYYDAYYDKAQRVRTLIRQDFEQAFQNCDVIVGPTAPTPPFKLGEKTDDPLTMYLADILTASLNLAGMPGMSTPAGFIENRNSRLPVGLQVIAAPFREDMIFRVAAAHEQLPALTKEAPIL